MVVRKQGRPFDLSVWMCVHPTSLLATLLLDFSKLALHTHKTGCSKSFIHDCKNTVHLLIYRLSSIQKNIPSASKQSCVGKRPWSERWLHSAWALALALCFVLWPHVLFSQKLNSDTVLFVCVYKKRRAKFLVC